MTTVESVVGPSCERPTHLQRGLRRRAARRPVHRARDLPGRPPLPVHDWLRPVEPRRPGAARPLPRRDPRRRLRPWPDERPPGRARPRRPGRRHRARGRRPGHGAVASRRCAATSSTRCRARDAGTRCCWPTATSASAARPARLLRRAAELLDRTGRVVCDLAAPGHRGAAPRRAAGHRRTKRPAPSRGPRSGPRPSSRSRPTPASGSPHVGEHHGRWFAVLETMSVTRGRPGMAQTGPPETGTGR